MRQKILMRSKQLMSWLTRHRRVVLIVIGAILALSVLLQVLFPSTKALPFTSVVGERVDFKSREDIARIAQEKFTNATVALVSDDEQYRQDLSVLGAKLNPDEMASEALDYPLVLRFLPFSGLWYHPQVTRFSLEFEDAQLEGIAKEASDALTHQPRDASLAIKDGELDVRAAIDGRKVSAEMVIDAIKHASYGAGETTKTVKGETVKPTISDEAIAAVRKEAEAMLARQITIRVDEDDEKTFIPSREEIARWITIATDDTRGVKMTLSQDTIASYLSSINKKVAIQPTVTTINLLDGKEQSRKNGSTGLAVPEKAAAKTIASRLMTTTDESLTLDVARKKVPSPKKYKRRYSSTQAGLTAYVQYITSKGDIKIAVRQLSGDGMVAYGGASDSIPAASTYKLYVMLHVFDDIRRDKRSWSDKIDDESLSTCVERMIVVSANNCAEALIKDYGPQDLTEYLRDKDFSQATNFNHPKAIHSSAADLVKLLSGIESKTLVNNKERNMLMEKMARQVYRNGIPAGSKGTVYDKVGFLWDYNHDAAIVRHPDGTYVMAVMTKGHSFGKIAEITRQIETIMYP